ncbi:MAG: division/cell wall cluster transcriptional repressor MraZ [Myxococcota bacterium]
MFAGRHDHSLDDKGRTMVPRDFRAALEEIGERTLYVTFGLGKPRHLEVRPESSFRSFQEQLTRAKNTAALEKFKIFYFGAAERVDIDKAGRILVPAALRNKVRLADKAVFVGVDSERFQIWRPEDLDDVYDYCDQNADHILDALGEVLEGS